MLETILGIEHNRPEASYTIINNSRCDTRLTRTITADVGISHQQKVAGQHVTFPCLGGYNMASFYQRQPVVGI